MSDLKDWKPTVAEFDRVNNEIFTKYASTAAAHDMLEAGDQVLAHSILFMRDSLFFWEFRDAIWDADVGQCYTWRSLDCAVHNTKNKYTKCARR
jgi:hypothetical protein